MGVVYHPNPLDAKTIGPLVSEYHVTFLLATPTFLQFYLRGCAPEQFGSLRFVLAGAEKLPERVAADFEEKFGLRPFEAYGCTECAPAVTVNTHDFRAADFGRYAKRGKIGHPLPGVCVRTRHARPGGDRSTGFAVGARPEHHAGLSRQAGENGGGFVTAGHDRKDVATLDEDGFLQITDRLSRFSKIGGEMAPHIRWRKSCTNPRARPSKRSWSRVSPTKKGERLMVLHKLPDDKIQLCLEKLTACDLPNLWKPKADAFVRLKSSPCSGPASWT